jgi:hypothetical protein
VGIIVGLFLLVSISNNVYITKFEFQGQALKDICHYGIYLCPANLAIFNYFNDSKSWTFNSPTKEGGYSLTQVLLTEPDN